MANPNTKQVYKPAYHLAVVGALFAVFVVLNLTHRINKDSVPPVGVEQTIAFVLSVRSFYLLPFVFLLLVGVAAKIKGRVTWTSWVRRVSFWVLSFFTGKLYTWGAFFLAWAFVPHFVSYVQPFPNAVFFGLSSIMLGWVIWLLARSFALWVWRQG